MIGSIVCVFGIDPGPTTGIFQLDYSNGLLLSKTRLQADAEDAEFVLEMLLAWYANNADVVKRFAGIEKFVTGHSAGTRGKKAGLTRQFEVLLAERLQSWGAKVAVRPTAIVKPWATDKRLIEAGLVGASALHGKARDTYDAGRHALYAAVHDAGMKDPLA